MPRRTHPPAQRRRAVGNGETQGWRRAWRRRPGDWQQTPPYVQDGSASLAETSHFCKSSQRHRCANPDPALVVFRLRLGRAAARRGVPAPPARHLFASVMGLSGLTLAWRVAHTSLGLPAVVGEAVGALALGVFLLLAVAYLTKLARHPEVVHAEFHHPVAGSFFGTIVIAV